MAVNIQTLAVTKAVMEEPVSIPFLDGNLCYFSRPCPGQSGNGDALCLVDNGAGMGLFLLADGAGGTPGGNECSGLLVNRVRKQFSRDFPPDPTAMRSQILDIVDACHEEIRERYPKGGTTLSALEFSPQGCRAYVIGDSAILIAGQRGKRKFQSVAHSPTGLAVEAGFLDEDEALKHPERSLVLNLLGLEDWSIGLSSLFSIDDKDTVLICSDGLTDNLTNTEIIECIRKGPLPEGARELIRLADERMTGIRGPYHAPDDLTFLLYRQGSL